MSIAREHACARLDDDTVKCCGTANRLRIGEPDGARGDAPSEMGDALPSVPLE